MLRKSSLFYTYHNFLTSETTNNITEPLNLTRERANKNKEKLDGMAWNLYTNMTPIIQPNKLLWHDNLKIDEILKIVCILLLLYLIIVKVI